MECPRGECVGGRMVTKRGASLLDKSVVDRTIFEVFGWSLGDCFNAGSGVCP